MGNQDFPMCLWYTELMRLYPDAKVILTARNPETWWTSFEGLLKLRAGLTGLYSPILRAASMLSPHWRRVTALVNGDFIERLVAGAPTKVN